MKSKALGHEIIAISSDEAPFPDKLRQISNPPKKLYCIGDLSLLKADAIAVVGSRKASEYGKQVAQKFGKEISENGLVHVSGMAKGIDKFSHLGALKNSGKSIAVLGSGVDVIYPHENAGLYDEIAKTGLIVSEYEPGFEPKAYTFPQRNRIISGLANAVVIVEAGTKSGSLITASLAMEQGKPVFAVPGNITSPNSLGTNKLIADGAQIVTVIDDVFAYLGIEPKVDLEEFNDLSEIERRVFLFVKEHGETTIEALCMSLSKGAVEMTAIVSILEMKGFVAYSLGKVFAIKF